jgi:hypothetical protein
MHFLLSKYFALATDYKIFKAVFNTELERIIMKPLIFKIPNKHVLLFFNTQQDVNTHQLKCQRLHKQKLQQTEKCCSEVKKIRKRRIKEQLNKEFLYNTTKKV